MLQKNSKLEILVCLGTPQKLYNLNILEFAISNYVEIFYIVNHVWECLFLP
jgi:hypothetical protein